MVEECVKEFEGNMKCGVVCFGVVEYLMFVDGRLVVKYEVVDIFIGRR